MDKFDPHGENISLYLERFERQADRAGISEHQLVFYLTGLLPSDINDIISREPKEKADSYEFVKNLLLKKYKLSSEMFRQLFYKQSKLKGTAWSDLVYKMTNYFQGWLEGMNVNSFEELKGLMVTDQMKRKVPIEVRDHLLDEWTNFKDPNVLAEKLDSFDAIRESMGRKTTDQYITDQRNKKIQFANPKTDTINSGEERRVLGMEKVSKPSLSGLNFEKRFQPKCYGCGSTQHFLANCPKKKAKDNEEKEFVGSLKYENKEKMFGKYLTKGIVNGYPIKILRDTGARVDVVAQKYVAPHMYTGETVWIQQALEVRDRYTHSRSRSNR
jgi:hypothetical protein